MVCLGVSGDAERGCEQASLACCSGMGTLFSVIEDEDETAEEAKDNVTRLSNDHGKGRSSDIRDNVDNSNNTDGDTFVSLKDNIQRSGGRSSSQSFVIGRGSSTATTTAKVGGGDADSPSYEVHHAAVRFVRDLEKTVDEATGAKVINQYVRVKKLGQGSYGSVCNLTSPLQH